MKTETTKGQAPKKPSPSEPSVTQQLRAKGKTEEDSPIPTYAAEKKKPKEKKVKIELGTVDTATKNHTRKKPKGGGILPKAAESPTPPKPKQEAAKPVEPTPEEPLQTAEEFDAEIEYISAKEVRKQQRSSFLRIRLSKLVVGVLVILCVYIAFLTYGLLQTSYVYNNNGEVVAEILSVDDLRELGQYEELSSYYLRTRILYEEVLKLDYALVENSDNSRAIARDYLALLDTVSKLSTDLSANELDIAYVGITNQIYELVYTHIAVYLQNMSGAITENNANKANQALQGRTVINEYFKTLTANMADLCHSTNGAKNGDIYNWSPDEFMNSLGGVN